MKSLKMMALNGGMDDMDGDEGEMKWRIEADLRAVIEAEKIKRDPSRMDAVKALAKEKKREYDEVAGSVSAKPMPPKSKPKKSDMQDDMGGETFDNFGDMGA